jgi:hypothetical protein
MEDDSEDESELLAALAAFGANDVDGSSGSDDEHDGIASVDTSAVARVLASRKCSDSCSFGALADALQTAAAAESAATWDEVLPDELQVMNVTGFALCLRAAHACSQGIRAARIAALEASLSDCKLLASSVSASFEASSYTPPPLPVDSAVSASQVLRLQVSRYVRCICSSPLMM